MTSCIFRRTIAVLMLAAGVLPAGSAAASGPLHTSFAPKGKKYAGPMVHMRWGSVQVTIAVRAKKIVNITASAPLDRPRSAFINAQALPLLKQEVLQAQSANVSVVSGATMTSNAYIKSLRGALRRAHL